MTARLDQAVTSVLLLLLVLSIGATLVDRYNPGVRVLPDWAYMDVGAEGQ